jgi:HAD superfamily hydrolase (TIGR01509 family)
MAVRAILFDLGNTLVGYYAPSEFPLVLRRCLRECATALGWPEDPVRDDDLFARALRMNHESPDCAVRPIEDRLQELFGAHETIDAASIRTLAADFLKPIFAMARLDPQAVPVLRALRSRGIKSAIVSNTPWGSPAGAWRGELARHGLLDEVDAAVFCMDVGWRKPHHAPFDRALSLLAVAPGDALFVGDDHRWDVMGARNAGLRPVLLTSSLATSLPDHAEIHDLRDILTVAAAPA